MDGSIASTDQYTCDKRSPKFLCFRDQTKAVSLKKKFKKKLLGLQEVSDEEVINLFHLTSEVNYLRSLVPSCELGIISAYQAFHQRHMFWQGRLSKKIEFIFQDIQKE